MLESGTRTSLSLAIIILLVGIVSIGQFLIMPLVMTYRANQIKIQETAISLERNKSLLAEQPVLLNQLSKRYDGAHQQTVYLEGPTPALAGVKLQDRVSHALEAVGSKTKSVEILSVVAVGDQESLDRVGLRARFAITSADLAALIYDLESGEPYLSLDKLVITKEVSSNAAQELEKEPSLDVTFDIFGFLSK